jgi:hypothetical protein
MQNIFGKYYLETYHVVPSLTVTTKNIIYAMKAYGGVGV